MSTFVGGIRPPRPPMGWRTLRTPHSMAVVVGEPTTSAANFDHSQPVRRNTRRVSGPYPPLSGGATAIEAIDPGRGQSIGGIGRSGFY